MLSRVVKSAISLAVPMLVFVSCGDGQPSPARTSTPTAVSVSASTVTPTPVSVAMTPMASVPSQSPTPTPVAEPTPTPTSEPTPTSTPTPTPAPEYLTQEIPPCTPDPGSSVDPCDPHAPAAEMSMAQYVPDLGDEPLTVREMLNDDSQPPAWVTHLTVRCAAPPAILFAHRLICKIGLVTPRRRVLSNATSTCARTPISSAPAHPP